MKKDFSKYPGLLKMCGYCSKKEKREGLEKEHYYCLATGKIVTERRDAMTCEEFDGAYLSLPQEK
jgi:hypothetical protein